MCELYGCIPNKSILILLFPRGNCSLLQPAKSLICGSTKSSVRNALPQAALRFKMNSHLTGKCIFSHTMKFPGMVMRLEDEAPLRLARANQRLQWRNLMGSDCGLRIPKFERYGTSSMSSSRRSSWWKTVSNAMLASRRARCAPRQ